MSKSIGTTIRRLRREKDITQEQLSEFLGVSAQAISQWERDISAPDISLIVPLANVFGVTTDELFDHSAAAEEAEIDALIQECRRLHKLERYDEIIALWRDAAAKYPRNFRCMEELAYALMNRITYGAASLEEQNKCAKEIIPLCERILSGCTESAVREWTIHLLVSIYSTERLACADEEKAVMYAEMAGSCYTGREILLERAYFTDESKEKRRSLCHTNIVKFLFHLSLFITGEERENDDEYILAQKTALKLWEAVMPDGNYLSRHTMISIIHCNLAQRYAKTGDRENTLKHMKSALYHASASDSIPAGEHHYTSPLICAAGFTRNELHLSTKSTVKYNLAHYSELDFLRSDPEYIAIMET